MKTHTTQTHTHPSVTHIPYRHRVRFIYHKSNTLVLTPFTHLLHNTLLPHSHIYTYITCTQTHITYIRNNKRKYLCFASWFVGSASS